MKKSDSFSLQKIYCALQYTTRDKEIDWTFLLLFIGHTPNENDDIGIACLRTYLIHPAIQ